MAGSGHQRLHWPLDYNLTEIQSRGTGYVFKWLIHTVEVILNVIFSSKDNGFRLVDFTICLFTKLPLQVICFFSELSER